MCLDFIVQVEDYPKEDSDCVLASSAPYKARGGNAANSSVVASQLASLRLSCALSRPHTATSQFNLCVERFESYGVHVQHIACVTSMFSTRLTSSLVVRISPER